MNKCIASAAIFLLIGAQSCLAQSEDPYSVENLATRYDWIIEAKVDLRKDFLKYPTSTLNPETKISVSYRLLPLHDKDRDGTPTQYENIFYKEAHPVGLRRVHSLDIAPGEMGAIRIIKGNSSDVSLYSSAIANAIVRLLLDAYEKKALVGSVIVPKEAFNQIVDSMGPLKFFNRQPTPGIAYNTTVSLNVTSDPPGEQAYLFYDEGR